MKFKTIAVAAFLAITLAGLPLNSAYAWGRHGGGRHGGGIVFGVASAIVATAAAVITAPFAIAAAVAQAPVFYSPPTYSGPATAYYNAPSPSPGYYGTPPAANYNAGPQPTPYYAAPPPLPSPPQAEWFYCSEARSYYPYIRDCPGGWQRVPAQPPMANYNPR